MLRYAGNLKFNRISSILNDHVSHFPSPALEHSSRAQITIIICFSSSKSTKSTITKTEDSKISAFRQIILDGPAKSGKSIALAMLVHRGRDQGWLVLYAPKGYLKGADTMPILEDSTLPDLVQMGIRSTHAAVLVSLCDLVKNSRCITIGLRSVKFEEPVTPRSCRPIHARELTTVDAFRSMMHDDMMVGAFSHSTAVGKLRKDLPDVPSDARQEFPRYSLDEAEAVCYYYIG
ncbi:hypothetical protein Bca52824_076288 [Brassica carinata]|uniref:Small ribosomal subunit protein mS29 n=1 Tax=Brassica carinata TaxID=52824 RepID=A0A8X7TX61_BRACI|nr:hypothetical protein Bca52824_076288 [Brassica carinata]